MRLCFSLGGTFDHGKKGQTVHVTVLMSLFKLRHGLSGVSERVLLGKEGEGKPVEGKNEESLSSHNVASG